MTFLEIGVARLVTGAAAVGFLRAGGRTRRFQTMIELLVAFTLGFIACALIKARRIRALERRYQALALRVDSVLRHAGQVKAEMNALRSLTPESRIRAAGARDRN